MENGRHWLSLITDAIMYTLHLFKQFGDFIWVKLIGLVLLIPMLAVDPDKQNASVALLCLICADFFTGVFAAYKTNHPIVSHKIYRSAVKLVVYFFLIAVARLTESAGFEWVDLDGAVIVFLAITEMISNLENVGRAGYVIPRKLLNLLLKYRDGDEIVKSHLTDAKP